MGIPVERASFHVGQSAESNKTITAADIQAFGDLVGDHNPIHFDEAAAARTRFGGRIAHGLLTASLLSAVLGMQIPGHGAVYLSQTLRFLGPVRIGDTVTARVEVAELVPERGRIRVLTSCRTGDGRLVVDGEAWLLLPGVA